MASTAFELPTSTKGYSDILANNIDYMQSHQKSIVKYFCAKLSLKLRHAVQKNLEISLIGLKLSIRIVMADSKLLDVC